MSSLQNTTKEDEEEKQQSLTEEEVKAKIEEYNSQVTENGMKLVSTDFSCKVLVSESAHKPIHSILWY